MKKILLIGKLNDIVKRMNDCLEKEFSIQICSESLELVRGMIKISRPDLAVISLVGLQGAETEIFDLLYNAYSQIPVIVVGTETEFSHCRGYFENQQFEKFYQEDSQEEFLNRCRKRLSPQDKDLDEESGTARGYFAKKYLDRKTILIVDDSALSLRSTKAMLDQAYNVFVATSGEKAIEAMQKRRPDLILLDYEMPGWNGKKTLEAIRSDENLADIPVIFLTAVADKENIAAVLRLKPANYILKPIEQQKIIEVVQKTLAEKK